MRETRVRSVGDLPDTCARRGAARRLTGARTPRQQVEARLQVDAWTIRSIVATRL